MTGVSNVNSAALLILQQAGSVGATEQNKSASDSLVAVANGIADKIGVTKQPGQAESKISEAMFSVTSVDILKEKLNLIDRAAEALGFDPDSYDSKEKLSQDMRSALIKIGASEGGDDRIAAMEKDLGLDKLGVSLMDVANSAKDPEADDIVTQALEEQAGEDKKSDKLKDAEPDASQPLLVKPDDAGLYSVGITQD